MAPESALIHHWDSQTRIAKRFELATTLNKPELTPNNVENSTPFNSENNSPPSFACSLYCITSGYAEQTISKVALEQRERVFYFRNPVWGNMRFGSPLTSGHCSCSGPSASLPRNVMHVLEARATSCWCWSKMSHSIKPMVHIHSSCCPAFIFTKMCFSALRLPHQRSESVGLERPGAGPESPTDQADKSSPWPPASSPAVSLGSRPPYD
jgi:hypothetical protein